MIEIDDVSRLYGGVPVVDHVTLTIQPRTICVVVGTSGSGKTTLLRMINKLVNPSSGSLRIDGEDIARIPAYELRRRIGYAIQGHGLFRTAPWGRTSPPCPSCSTGTRQKRLIASMNCLPCSSLIRRPFGIACRIS
jgi:ABC-type nitrate/sulfonate/bicarbonate transport system ATPase subunit